MMGVEEKVVPSRTSCRPPDATPPPMIVWTEVINRLIVVTETPRIAVIAPPCP